MTLSHAIWSSGTPSRSCAYGTMKVAMVSATEFSMWKKRKIR